MAGEQSQQNPQEQLKGLLLKGVGVLMIGAVVVGALGCLASLFPGGEACGANGASWMLAFSGIFLAVIGAITDFIITNLVLKMGYVFSPQGEWGIGSGIQIGWRVMRDLMNLAFIGGLIYAAFSMILGLLTFNDRPGKLIIKILIAALLVNFSYFFAGAVIDASNFTANIIYTQTLATDEISSEVKGIESLYGPLTINFMNAVGLTSIYKFSDTKLEGDNDIMMLLYGLLGSLLFLTTAASFFYVGGLFMKRFVIIIYLLITSPLGVVGFTGIPVIKEWGTQWWKTLSAQAIFPPVFFILIAISYKMIDAVKVTFVKSNILSDNPSFTTLINPEGVANAGDIGATFEGAIGLIIFFIIAIGLIIIAASTADKIAREIPSTPPTGQNIADMFTKIRVVGLKGAIGGATWAAKDHRIPLTDAKIGLPSTFKKTYAGVRDLPGIEELFGKRADDGKVKGGGLLPRTRRIREQEQAARDASTAREVRALEALEEYRNDPNKDTSDNVKAAAAGMTDEQLADFARSISSEEMEALKEAMPEKREIIDSAMKDGQSKEATRKAQERREKYIEKQASGGGHAFEGSLDKLIAGETMEAAELDALNKGMKALNRIERANLILDRKDNIKDEQSARRIGDLLSNLGKVKGLVAMEPLYTQTRKGNLSEQTMLYIRDGFRNGAIEPRNIVKQDDAGEEAEVETDGGEDVREGPTGKPGGRRNPRVGHWPR